MASSSSATGLKSRTGGRPSADEMLRAALAGQPVAIKSSTSVLRNTSQPSNGARTAGGETSRDVTSTSRGAPRIASVTRTRSPPPMYSSKVSLRPAPMATPASKVPMNPEKLRKFQLERKIELANGAARPRNTAGLFKAARSTDLLFLVDTTMSMRPYLEAAKQQIRDIVNDLKAASLSQAESRIAVVSYKDHGALPNVEFLDFTTSVTQVTSFLDTLVPQYGFDLTEDVLGGIQQATEASWKNHTRCVIHIGDAPPHGSSLHDFVSGTGYDRYPAEGSEPHGYTYQPLVRKLVELKINYVFLQIKSDTDRMAYTFSAIYGHQNTTLLDSNKFHGEAVKNKAMNVGLLANRQTLDPQFEERRLGTSYQQLRHLVVSSVTASVTRSAGRLSAMLPTSSDLEVLAKLTDANTKAVSLESGPPQWDTRSWLDEMLEFEGFCPAIVVHNAQTLNEMMDSDKNIQLSEVELTVYARSKPFAKGSVRAAAYATTAASTSHYVIKSFLRPDHGMAHLAEDMRMQALCKAFALQFNDLLAIEPPLDFIVTSCLQRKTTGWSENEECVSLEPYLAGEYVKYNSNCGFVDEYTLSAPFGQMAQAFSHFTFERSWGHLLVSDLQGVGRMLTDPSIQTKDPERFKLNPTNLREEGFKFFFATHTCNTFCKELGLLSNLQMFGTEEWEFREIWPTMNPTVCCSNKLCRRIIRVASAYESNNFPGHHWCGVCWQQLQDSLEEWACDGPGPNHTYKRSRFFHESQGERTSRMCPDHQKRVSTATTVGSNFWRTLKEKDSKSTISGKVW